jgi:hypothetical protein
LAKVDTGVLVLSHSDDNGKQGAGGAALRGDGQTLYVLGNKGLAVFDCRNPAAPARLAVIDTFTVGYHSGAAVAFHNDGVTMYIADGKGLSVFDVSNRRAPNKVGSTLETGALSSNGGAALAFDGDRRLYVAGGKGLVVYDVGPPNERAPRKVLIPPRQVGLIDTGAIGMVSQCALCFSHPGTTPRALYVAGGKGLAVFDLANPDLPQKVGKTVNTGVLKYDGGAALALHPQKALIFVAGGSGLALLDISNPFAPFVSMKFENTGCLRHRGGASLAVDGTTLLLAGGNGLGAYELPPQGGDIKRVTRRGTNVGWKQNRTLETGVFSPDGATALLMDGGVVYAAGGRGLAVFDAQQLLGRTCSRAALGPLPGAGIPWPPPPPPGTDAGVKRTKVVVKVELPVGKLGLTVVTSPPEVGAVRTDSPVVGQVAPGDIIVSLTRPGMGDVDTTNMDGQAVMETLIAFADREGRSLTVAKHGVYGVGVPPRPLGVSFVNGTCTVHAVKPTSPLLGATKAGDTLFSVNGKPVTPTTILDVIKAADDGTSERKLVFRDTAPATWRV